jgi:N-sulfoglucosamine sulfohydrolase
MNNNINRRQFLSLCGLGAAGCVIGGCGPEKLEIRPDPVVPAKTRPNILWLSCEDTSPNLGCYGDRFAHTPTLDRLATEGMRFTNVYTAAPVCAPNRSAVITGVFAPTLGSHPMRSGGEGSKLLAYPKLPDEVRCFSEYLRTAGYYCTNNVKQDYNFETPDASWDDSSNKAHWRNRPKPEQPFFAVFNYLGTHESAIRSSPKEFARWTQRLTPEDRQDPATLELPPYYPDTPEVRRQWANYYELITALDYWVADHLAELEKEGLAEDTIVFFWSDHGVGLPRAKRWVYDSGTHVPLIVRIPTTYRITGQGIPGTVVDDLISSVDFSASTLNLAGVPIPAYLQGRPFLGGNLPGKREYVYTARDRMDERPDMIRAVRDRRYRYIRNYRPELPYAQHLQYAEVSPVMKALRKAKADGSLPEAAKPFMADSKPPEELYDTQKDPYEIHNLIDDPKLEATRVRLQAALSDWMETGLDLGFVPESILAEAERNYGSRYALYRRPNGVRAWKKLANLVPLTWHAHPIHFSTFADGLHDPDAAVRYWSAIGLANSEDARPALDAINAAMLDESGVVRVAAAKALLRLGQKDRAIAEWVALLKSPQEWVAYYAMLELDELGVEARPVIEAVRAARDDKRNPFVTRVGDHLLSVLEGKEI